MVSRRGGLRCGVSSQVVLQRGVLQAAHAAPEVQLPAGQPQTHLILAADLGLARQVQVARHAGAGAVGLHSHGRKLIGALDAVQGARFLHTRQRRAQIAVVGQSGIDQCL
ncbi:hypothetical protein G6F65_022782 [Rhizopus arrhizus]|nr:hypothetical protein G6F65_022782 [Rhizopus arrhizus]